MPQIIPIKDLKKTSEISEMCHNTNEPVFITKNGYGDMVIMSMEVYEETMKKLDIYRNIEISEEQVKNGQVKDAKKSLENMRAKYCKSQYKNVGLGQYKNVGFPTFLYCLFSLHLL